jgi:cell division protein FtsZ
MSSSNYITNIKVVGVGGGGANAVNRMIEVDLQGVDYVAMNTDAQVLASCNADIKLDLGRDITKGLGAGADPAIGQQSAEAHKDEIAKILEGSDMVFIAAGEGGGTGTGAAPIIANVAKELGALTVAVVTRPFGFEGTRRANIADIGIEELTKEVDAIIVVPNDSLLKYADVDMTAVSAFNLANDVLLQGVRGISTLITQEGFINIDFSDVKTILLNSGTTLMGIGQASGENRAIQATEQAVQSAQLETSIEGATRVLVNIAASKDLGIKEYEVVNKIINDAVDPNAQIIIGEIMDDSLNDELVVTVIAAGFPNGFSSDSLSLPETTISVEEEIEETPEDLGLSIASGTADEEDSINDADLLAEEEEEIPELEVEEDDEDTDANKLPSFSPIDIPSDVSFSADGFGEDDMDELPEFLK